MLRARPEASQSYPEAVPEASQSYPEAVPEGHKRFFGPEGLRMTLFCRPEGSEGPEILRHLQASG